MEEASKKSGETIEVFFSYSHKDERMREKLEKHLSALRRENVIAGWHDRKIMPGTEWKDQIDEHIETARIILLLVSAEFLSSDYCYDVELKRAIARHDAGDAIIKFRSFSARVIGSRRPLETSRLFREMANPFPISLRRIMRSMRSREVS